MITLGKSATGTLSLPLDMATESMAIIARRGAGKSYTGRVIAEDLLVANVQMVVIDPLDVWWGLRHTHQVVIMGGSQADLPLVETAGRAIADLIVDQGISAILVLDDLSLAGQRRFVADFCEQLFERKRSEEHRTPLHLMLDEADIFAPQRVPPEGTRCAGTVDRVVRRGRSRGLGSTVITQRPAVLSKDVLTQTEMLICLQVTGPQDRKALREWIDAHGDPVAAKVFLDSLASLARGEAWAWSPAKLGLFERVTVRKARCYDSSYTPKVGEKRPTPPGLMSMDIEPIAVHLADVIQEAQANDPTALKKRIRELEAAQRTKAPSPDGAEAAVRHAAQRQRDQEWSAALDTFRAEAEQIILDAHGRLRMLAFRVDHTSLATVAQPVERPLRKGEAAGSKPARSSTPSTGPLSKAERAIVAVLVQHGQCSKAKVALLAGYSAGGGGFNNALSRLRGMGVIVGSDQLIITEVGSHFGSDVEPLPTGKALHDLWRERMGKCERAIFDVLLAWPHGLEKAALAEATGYEAGGGGFNNAISRLRTMGVITGRDRLAVADEIQGQA